MPTFCSRHEIAERIKRDMYNKRLSQKAMAQELGVSESYLSDFLTGKRGLGRRILAALGYGLMPFYRKEKRDGGP